MKTALIAAAAFNHPGTHSDNAVGVYIGTAFGLYIVVIALGWALGALRDRLPRGKWRNRVHLAALLIFYPQTFFLDNKSLSNSIRTQVHNLFAVRNNKYVGTRLVNVHADDTAISLVVISTEWDGGDIMGTSDRGGRFNISELLLNGQQKIPNGGWFLTAERWLEVQEKVRADAQLKAEGTLSPDVLTALQILGLSTESPATLANINAARNKLLKTVHPDHGGSTEMAQLINNAHDLLSKYVVA
jgi:hypothetical protein